MQGCIPEEWRRDGPKSISKLQWLDGHGFDLKWKSKGQSCIASEANFTKCCFSKYLISFFFLLNKLKLISTRLTEHFISSSKVPSFSRIPGLPTSSPTTQIKIKTVSHMNPLSVLASELNNFLSDYGSWCYNVTGAIFRWSTRQQSYIILCFPRLDRIG